MSDETYTHDPSAVEEIDGYEEADEYGAAGKREADRPESIVRQAPTADGREFDWRGWVLVGWLVVAFLVVPGYLFFYPHASETLSLLGLGYRDTYLFFPLLPAILLGLLAIWATTRP